MGNFAPLMYLRQSLEYIDAMPQGNFDECIEKYVEMNIAHPFRKRTCSPWLDLILKQECKQLVDWNRVDKDDYLSAMQRSVVKDIETLLKQALKFTAATCLCWASTLATKATAHSKPGRCRA